MKKVISLYTLVCSFIVVNGQNPTVLITEPDYTTAGQGECNCATTFTNGSAVHFFDSGDTGANYGNNENDTITFCPILTTGTKMTITVGINAGFTWDVDTSDTLYVYDGPNVNSPLLGAHNSSNSPNGFGHQASWNNPSGCLTIRFSSDGTTNGTGWGANVSCGNPPQPFTPHMQAFINGVGSDALTPTDTGYVDVCFGDSILFVGSGLFPNDSTVSSPYGYAQLDNVDFDWEFSDGTSATGDSVWFTPPTRSGYLVLLKVKDQFPQTEIITSKARVSTIPSFIGIINNRDSICLGDTTVIFGGVTNSDTVGVDPTTSSFQLGGTFAGLVYLPDGSGLNYTDTINISGFNVGQNITTATDIERLFINIEHSFIGDLEMSLTCPNGTQVNIFNSYDGVDDLFGGGFYGQEVHLGDAYDENLTNPGVGWEYNFYDNPAFPTFATAFNNAAYLTTVGNGTTNPFNEESIIAGDYQTEQSYTAFIGCPLNGSWVVTVRDNLNIDDGYIFEWGIFFDPLINPNNETYAPYIATEYWMADPTIISGQSDTAITVRPLLEGANPYTYEVTDNFGCSYDTTVLIHVLPVPKIQADTSSCNNQYQVVGTTSYLSQGYWTFIGAGMATFSPDDTSLNPFVNVSIDGEYTLTYTDNQCHKENSFSVDFIENVSTSIDSISTCIGTEVIYDVTQTDQGATYLWYPSGTTTSTLYVTPTDSIAELQVITIFGTCNTVTDTATVTGEGCTVVIPNIITPNIITPNGDGMNDFLVFINLEFHPKSHLIIFNRWGNKVYESLDYQNDWNAEDVSDGTYFYILTPVDELNAPLVKSTVTILK